MSHQAPSYQKRHQHSRLAINIIILPLTSKLEYRLIVKIKVDCDEGIFEGKNVCDGSDCGTWTCELIGEGMCSVMIDHNL